MRRVRLITTSVVGKNDEVSMDFCQGALRILQGPKYGVATLRRGSWEVVDPHSIMGTFSVTDGEVFVNDAPMRPALIPDGRMVVCDAGTFTLKTGDRLDCSDFVTLRVVL